MAVDLVVPEAGESIREVQIGRWLKRPGEFVQKDEPVVEIESDKVTFELFAPVSGIVGELLKADGEVAAVGEVIGSLTESAGPTATETASGPAHAPQPDAPTEPEATPVSRATTEARVMPAAQRMLEEAGVKAEQVPATGPGGRVLKEDVQKYLTERAAPAAPAPAKAAPATADGQAGFREEEAVPMTPMRRRIAERLVAAQQTAAMLTTFNECDMSAVMDLRRVHQDAFTKQYGVKLGFMSFFVKACVDGLKRIPELNAELRGTDIVYHNYYDIGIAVSGKKGLAVPVVRNAERMSFAEIEQKIGDFGARARDNKLELEELQGGTFTITNGGVFGSMMSTPILNPPQSGILGLHAINERPVAVDGQVVIRPMMYLALTYDHRIVDGREAVTFLKRIKEVIENPTRMLIEI